jgi:hypothetical protein
MRSDFTSANEMLAIFREKKGIHGAVGAFPIFAQCIRGVLQRVCENDASQESRYSLVVVGHCIRMAVTSLV